MSLEGKVALITGAGKGIGRAIALRLARDGADVVVNDIDGESARQVADEITQLGRRSFAIQADVSQSVEVNEMFAALLKRFGRLDILVNNAGVGPVKTILECTEAEWDEVFAVNVKGVFLCSQAAARQMVKQRSGKIINAASVAGIRGVPYFVPYCATKAAVIVFTQGLARELAPFGITVNAYCPGIIDTDLTANTHRVLARYWGLEVKDVIEKRIADVPLGRMGQPEDVAGLVAFLASSDADYITGQSIPVGGGVVMC